MFSPPTKNETPGGDESAGAKRLSSTHIFAVFDQNNARRYVYVRMSQSQPDLLWAWIYTDFKDPTRSNYGVYDWFRRVEH